MEIFKLGAELKKYSIALPNVAEYFDDDRLRHSYHSFGQNQNVSGAVFRFGIFDAMKQLKLSRYLFYVAAYVANHRR